MSKLTRTVGNNKSFSDYFAERQKTGFSISFFVCDVVLPFDTGCCLSHLLMTGIGHGWIEGEGFQCLCGIRFDGRFEKFDFQCILCCGMKNRT